MAEQSCETYGYKPSEKLHEIFTKYHKTHNQGVFDIYTPEMMKARHNKILTGLPDTYGRGRIVGDYRRVALYGIDYLIERKKADFAATNRQGMRRGDFQLREEIADQVRALQDMKVMAQSYGYDISEPAKNAREAVQWLYFGYLAAIKTQNGAAMSVGRVSTFLDIYIERDIVNSQEFRLTISCSPVTRYGLLWKLPVWESTDVLLLQRTISVSCIHWKTWDRPQSRTLLFCTLSTFRKLSKNMQLIFLYRQAPSSMRTMM